MLADSKTIHTFATFKHFNDWWSKSAHLFWWIFYAQFVTYFPYFAFSYLIGKYYKRRIPP